jgi:LuxR family transcriptional regulator, maltose regulon positive regulatory protein
LLVDWPMPQVFSMGYCLQTRLKIVKGDLSGARETLTIAEELQQNNDFHPEFRYNIERTQLLLWSAEQNQFALEAFAEQVSTLVMPELHFRDEARLIQLARAWLELDRHREAAELLERLSQSTGERKGSRIAILALLVSAHYAEPVLAEAALDEALRLAMPEGYLRTFLEAGESLRQTLESWLKHNDNGGDEALRSYARRILRAFERPSTMLEKATKLITLPEQLSRREQEVLQLIAKGLTNQQIAERLVISIRTVKKHVENIHGKLGVQSRTQAAARARELGLFDS